MKVFTLGTANRQHFDFTKILNKYGIQVVIDIRRNPTMPQSPQFSRDSLQMLCASQKADYVYLGNDLGRNLPAELRPSEPTDRFVLKEWQTSSEFQQVVRIVAAKAEKRVTCILCSERLPDDCQRFFLTQELARLGFEVAHILDETRIWSPTPARPARQGFRPRVWNRRPREGRSGSGRPPAPR
jgi:uncharacterized protein (DUF488 family)